MDVLAIMIVLLLLYVWVTKPSSTLPTRPPAEAEDWQRIIDSQDKMIKRLIQAQSQAQMQTEAQAEAQIRAEAFNQAKALIEAQAKPQPRPQARQNKGGQK